MWETNATALNSIYAKWTNSRKELHITAYNHAYGNDLECINLNIVANDTITSTTYYLDQNNVAYYRNIFPLSKDSLTYSTNSNNTGLINISLDLVNNRVSGFFFFTPMSTIDVTKMHIDNGTFSMPYTTD
jgi:hypothetical protein